MSKEKEVTKSDITTTDAIYIIFAILMAFFFISIAVVCVLLLISAFMAIGQAGDLSSPAKVIALAFIVILCVALFVYLDYLIAVTTFKSSKKYLKERKEALEKIESKTSQNN